MLMVRKIPARLRRHKVSVEPFEGTGAYGRVYGPAAEVRVLLSERTQVVRAPDGTEVVSGASYLADPEHMPPAESRVTLPDGRVTTVITTGRVGVDLPVPANTEVLLV